MDYREFLGNDYDVKGLTKAQIDTLVKTRIPEISENLKNIIRYKMLAEERERLYTDITGEDAKFDMDVLFGSLDDLTIEEYDENLKAIEEWLCENDVI